MGVNCLSCTFGSHVIQQRYILCFLAFLGIVNDYTLRNCLNIAITEMVRYTPKVVEDKPITACPSISNAIKMEHQGYNWSPNAVASVLASFFPGYIITHVPGGFLADTYGAKHVIGVGVAISAVLSAVTPIAIEMGGWELLCVLRFIMGMVQGALFPAITTFLARWVPKSQRARLGGLVFTGPQIGSILCNIISGYILSATGNWRLVFYFWALIAVIWYVLYSILFYSEPASHPFVTPEEKEMLIAECGTTRKLAVPWKRLVFYKPTFALFAGQAGHGVLFLFVVVNLPKYFKDVLRFNIQENGVLSSLPYAALWISGAISGVIADYGINNGLFSVIGIRKLYTTIASVGASICTLLAGSAGCSRNTAALWFILAMFFKGPFYTGLRVNALDITKNFSGILSAFVNCAGSLAYYPIPYLIAIVAKDNTVPQWMIIFWVIFVISSITNIIYVLWASADIAEWDKVD